jgi:hypothetical protein
MTAPLTETKFYPERGIQNLVCVTVKPPFFWTALLNRNGCQTGMERQAPARSDMPFVRLFPCGIVKWQ